LRYLLYNRLVPSGEPQSRRVWIVALAIVVLFLSFLLFSQTSLNLGFLQPETLQQTLAFIALSALIFLLFVALTFVLARNLLKLFAERRIGVLGSRFRTRMVLGALVLSFLPTIFLFLFSYVLMNRTIDKWFSRPVEELKQDTAEAAGFLSEYAAANAKAEATSLAANDEIRRAFRVNDFNHVDDELKRHSSSLQGGFVILVRDRLPVHSFLAPAEATSRLQNLIDGANTANHPAAIFLNGNQFLAGLEPLNVRESVLVGLPLPARLSETLARIESNQRRYYELSQQRRSVRRLFMQLLLLITVLVLFASTWLSMFIARLVTRPVSALAEATKEISEGHLDYRIQVPAADELGELVASFNRMAAELEQNRRHIETAGRQLATKNRELSEANAAIEQRRHEIEKILENVPTGVLSLDSSRRVTLSNRSFEELFGVHDVEPGTSMQRILEGAPAEELEMLLRRADRMGTASRQIEHLGTQMEITAASLQQGDQHGGYVVVFEDLSELLKAQKQLAWQEVARRVAHEIKNPLTPIALSAERIRKHLDRPAPLDGGSLAVIHGCAETISGAVETVRTLVDEFATLARFPTAQPQPTSVNTIVESALAMFNGRLEGIQVRMTLAPGLPDVMADPEAIKRVVANLVDNAAEAMQDAMLREIQISTALVSEAERPTVEITVADTGHGVSAELKEKLFLPYFSTKERGTGLGLAIVNRIVEEHRGSVRVEKNQPTGARFVVELPVSTKP
jgi:two-component system, NtrC family, nitrogen regulation sensor histidine kinase NtrY